MTAKLQLKNSAFERYYEKIGKIEIKEDRILLTQYFSKGTIDKLDQYKLETIEYLEILP